MQSPSPSDASAPAPDVALPAAQLLVAIPFYKNEGLVETIVASLIACRDDLAALKAEVILFNDSPDYAPLGAALNAVMTKAQAAFPCRLVRNQVNLGFVRTMNQALSEAARRRVDIVLLNSDTVVYPGALTEMARVATLDPMIGFINPRSNNATLATLPHQTHLRSTPEKARAAAAKVAAALPDYTYTPTAVGFCMLIRWHVLAEFGVFDEIYGRGYNEENDLVMRAGRCGYRAVLANKAYVWHEGEVSFAVSDAPKNELDAINAKILLARYPEYDALVRRYFQSPEYAAEELLATFLGAENGKLDLAFDFSSFGTFHNGTFKGAEQVLREAAKQWRDKFNLYILCDEDVYAFHDYAKYNVPRRAPHGPERFAVIFRVGQFYDWNAIERMVQKGACLGVYMLDTISIDCVQLNDARIFNIWQFALDQFDLVATTSVLTTDQFTRRFSFNPAGVRVRTMHSLDLAEYAPGEAAPAASGATMPAPGYTLIVGNHFPHKFVTPTARALARAFPDRTFVAFADRATRRQTPPARGQYDPRTALTEPNVIEVPASRLTDSERDALLTNAALIVFPSHYEGFGLPVLEALAVRKPAVTRRTPVATEIHEALGRQPNLHLYDTTEDLVALMAKQPTWIETNARPPHNAADAAIALRAGIDQALGKVSHAMLLRRLRGIEHARMTASTMYGGHGPAAQLAGQLTERFAGRLLRSRIVYAVSRGVFRSVLAVYRGGRALMSGDSS